MEVIFTIYLTVMKTRYHVKTRQLLSFLLLFTTACSQAPAGNEKKGEGTAENGQTTAGGPAKPAVDTALYNRIIKDLTNNDTTGKWPAQAPIPLPGSVLPFNRIVAFYGNLFSKKMGILGEIPKKEMLAKLKREVANWQAADTSIPVIPALHYVAVTAQGTPQKDNMYRYRMPFKQIDTIVSWAKEINGLVFVDVQVAHSTVKTEVPFLEPYLKMPNVHLGIDPEFSLKNGEIPGSKIGSFNADDINSAIDFLADVVRKNNIPPKILIIHRFTQGMVTGFDQIKKVPEVQIVMDMDGWGPKFLKRSTYLRYIKKEPVQFTGFKLFYHNDTKTGANQLYAPQELLQFTPKPIYIQYQ